MLKTVTAFTIPNVITIFRICMAIAAAVLFAVSFAEKLAAALCLSAVLLDAFDGWYARTFSQCSSLGKLLDPLADKIVIAVIYTVIAVQMNSPLVWILFGLILMREIVVTFLRGYAFRRYVVIDSSRLGKLKMLLQSIVGSCILVYVYFFAGVFSVSVYIVAPALVLIVFVAYFSAYQYIITWKTQKEIQERAQKPPLDEPCHKRLVVEK